MIRPYLGRLPDDVRTHLIASNDKENVLLAKLLLIKTDSGGIITTKSRG